MSIFEQLGRVFAPPQFTERKTGRPRKLEPDYFEQEEKVNTWLCKTCGQICGGDKVESNSLCQSCTMFAHEDEMDRRANLSEAIYYESLNKAYERQRDILKEIQSKSDDNSIA